MEHMQLVFTDAVVENSISGSRWVGEGEKEYEVLCFLGGVILFVDDPGKKKRKNCHHYDSHCVRVKK